MKWFKGAYGYKSESTETLEYLWIVKNALGLEFLMRKQLEEREVVLEMEESILKGIPFFVSEPEEEFGFMNESKEKDLSSKVVQRMISLKKGKASVEEEMAKMGNSFG